MAADPYTTLAALALLVLALVVAGCFWLWWVGRRYRLVGERPHVLEAVCADGWELAVHHRPARVRRFREPVLLCHGLAANHYYFDFDPPHSVAVYLAEAGFECFTVEWRGTGGSRRPPPGRHWSDYTVDDHIRYDGPALIDLALRHVGAEKAFWLGHSLGGLIGYGVAQLEHGARLAGLSVLGAPGLAGADRAVRAALRVALWAAWPRALRHEVVAASLAPLFGWVTLPFTDYVANPKNVPARLQRQLVRHVFSSVGRRMLAQLHDWLTHDAFRSLDGSIDYRAGMKRIQLPVLVMAGSDDKLAPPEVARAQIELLGSADRTLVVFGKDRGDRQAYGHGDLVFGQHAPDEVFPVIRAWLEARATKVAHRDGYPEGAGSPAR